MRIAVFSDNFYPELSGVSDSIITAARELARRGHTIRFFVPKYAPRDYRALGFSIREPALHERISVTRFASLPYGGPSGQARIVVPTGLRTRLVREFKPDLIHTHSIFGVGLEALAAARLLHHPLVGTNHTPLAEFIKYSPIRLPWFTSLLLSYDAWYYNRCAFVSSPAAAIFKEMERYGFRAPRRAISNPIDTALFHPSAGDRNAFKRELGFAPFTILYAGRLAPEKRIDLLLEAFAARKADFPGAALAIAGKGPSEAGLRAKAEQLGIEKQVQFLGFLPKDTGALARAYRACDLFASMSPVETQSTVAMQALSSGIPAVGSDAWGIGEYLRAAGQLTVAPGDVQGLAAHFAALFKNPQLRAALGAKGRAFAETISAPAIADEWERVYENTAAEYHR
ncbi:MAG: glycosyltransferase [Candidatus Liptonbacteria bacterium]|nr:glycosyltransferase [Candidatus Liptonbacteria bacterium]